MRRAVHVELGRRSYDVSVGAGLLAQAGRVVRSLAGAERAVMICDSRVAGLHGERGLSALRGAGVTADLLMFPAGEEHKTLATCSALYDAIFALRPRVDRRTAIVALGGGVTGDVAGFIAATALRGLRFLQCPTTLLAAVDSSVGGKTGVDHPAGKNLIGAFHQPVAVLVDVDLLKTLPDAELPSGLAECVKHGVIRDAGLLEWIESRSRQILAREPESLIELIARNVAIKAAVVSADEREAGERMELNFGHTIGHAIETRAGYGRLSHGQAVAIGMAAACRIAAARGLLDAESARRVGALLSALGLPAESPAGAQGGELWPIMLQDKKAVGGKVRMVLPVRLGKVAVFDDITPQEVEQSLGAVAARK
jgi:3-dehydroquinate synthase